MSEAKKVIKYSREAVLACREAASRMNFPMIVIPTRVPRGARKKSQSTDADGANAPGGSHEDLNTEEVSASWHRPSRHNTNSNNNHSNQSHHQQPGHFPTHSRQRYPSGPHADLTHSSANISLRAAPPTENRHGCHGDWSRGCAGWRQRSYSGSERSELVLGTGPLNFRGRGGHSGFKRDEAITRGRGWSRAGRGGLGSRGHHNNNRPVSFIGPVNASQTTEEFWQDEDWDSMGLDSTAHVEFPSKPRERLNSKTSVDGSLATSIESPSAQPPTANVPTELIKDFKKLRVYSKSCSADPPPGFDVSSLKSGSIEKRPGELSEAVSLQQSAENAEPSNTSRSDATSSRWYYIDSVGKTQGPFIQQQMCVWFTGGFLPVTIEVRRECDECFLTLGDHMNLTGRIPFSDDYPLPPLTRSSLPSVVAASKKTVSNPRWIGQLTSSTPPATSGIDSPGASPSIHNVMAAATAAAPALALFFATAAGLASPVSQTSQAPARLQVSETPSPTQPQPQPTTLARDLFKTPEETKDAPVNPTASLHQSDPEILRLYTEAHALAAHAAKVEAERQELVDKIAAINSTAAKLLAASPGLSSPSIPVIGENGRNLPDTEVVECKPETNLINSFAPNVSVTADRKISYASAKVDEPETPQPTNDDTILQTNISVEPVPSKSDDSQLLSRDRPADCSSENKQVTSESSEVSGKKSKKKKNKPKKKLTAEQERQMAWNAEFERRKAAALERKLAEEAEEQRIAEEEAAAIAAAEQAQMKEQLRLAAEQRKREAARAKAANQMGQLQLPKAACWGNSSSQHDSNATHSSAATSGSLLEIQAAQALEEEQKRKHEAFMAEQATLLAATEAVVAQSKPQAWSSVVNTNSKNSAKQVPKPKPNATKADLPSVKSVTQGDRSKPPQQLSAPATGNKVHHTTPSVGPTKTLQNAASNSNPAGLSIWDLPNDGKIDSTTGTGKNSKKHSKKKNLRATREAASYAAKEQLAHWCESQLSSMPLSGVDLPTLVDLLCELEAAEQIVEFIESSLGRSKQISQFSKAFLEKRACVLNAP